MNLRRKVGPFPLWLLLLVAAAVAYYLYRRHTNQAGSNAVATQSLVTSSATPSEATGLVPSAGAPATSSSAGDTGQSTSDLVSALGGQQASLLQALEATQQNLIELAGMQIAAAQQSPQISPSSTTETQPYTVPQPGGSNAPQVYYLAPNVSGAPSSSAPAPTTAPKPAAKVTPLRYYTYKSQVPLGPNQTVHFTTGRGYYAA